MLGISPYDFFEYHRWDKSALIYYSQMKIYYDLVRAEKISDKRGSTSGNPDFMKKMPKTEGFGRRRSGV